MLGLKKNTIMFLMIIYSFFIPLIIQISTINAQTDISNTKLTVELGSDNSIIVKAENVSTGDPILAMLNKYRDVLVIFSTLATITFGFLFVVNIMKLAQSGSNPFQRQAAIGGLVVCGICCGLLGGLTVVIAFFQNFLLIE